MSDRSICILSNTLRLTVVSALWVIGKLLDQWEMDLWTMAVFAVIYLYTATDCSCSCKGEDSGDDE